GGSRATRVYGNAAYEAGTKVKAEILAVVAENFAAKPEELELNNGRVLHKESKRKMSFAQVVKAKGSPIKVKGYYKSAEKAHDASISAQISEVHEDAETGQVTLQPITSANTTGT